MSTTPQEMLKIAGNKMKTSFQETVEFTNFWLNTATNKRTMCLLAREKLLVRLTER